MKSKTVILLIGCAIMVLLALVPSIPFSLAQPKESIGKSRAESDRKAIVKILKSKEIWESGFSNALVRFNVWSEAKEKGVAVYPKKIVGARRYKTEKEAEQTRVLLDKWLDRKPPQLRPDFSFLAEGVREKPYAKTRVVTNFAGDESIRVVWESEKVPLLRRHVPIKEVYKEFGKPARVWTLILRSPDGDGRPMILTIHTYAGGAIQFAQSDWSAKPGSVDRVLLNVGTLSKILFEEYKEK